MDTMGTIVIYFFGIIGLALLAMFVFFVIREAGRSIKKIDWPMAVVFVVLLIVWFAFIQPMLA